MANGVEMQNALEQSLKNAAIKAIQDWFVLDWDNAVDEVYKGFIRDFKDDAVPDLMLGVDGEVLGIVLLADESDSYVVGRKVPLAEMFIELAECHGETKAVAAIEGALAKLKAEIAKHPNRYRDEEIER